MSYILCFFVGTLTTFFVSRVIRGNHGDECELPPTMCTPPICGKSFSFVRNGLGRHVDIALHLHIGNNSLRAIAILLNPLYTTEAHMSVTQMSPTCQ
jgi:hypothetical protein